MRNKVLSFCIFFSQEVKEPFFGRQKTCINRKQLQVVKKLIEVFDKFRLYLVEIKKK